MRSVEDHRRHLLDQVRSLAPRRIPVLAPELLGSVLAADVVSGAALPGFDNSAMDGYAVRAADVADAPVTLPVDGDIPAGDTRSSVLQPGTAWRIMTGAPVPAGADSVVQVELTDGGTHQVRVEHAVAPGTAVRRLGGDVRKGDVVALAGTRVAPWHMPAIVSAGHAEVDVIPRPRVGIVTTGDELRPAGSGLAYGQVIDCNGPMLASLVTAHGFVVGAVRTVGDGGPETRAALTSLAGEVDAIVTSGGVSAGAFEPLKLAFADDFEFTQVAMQPGKPQGFGMLGDVPVFCLPGNPVSSLVSFEVFVAPALRRMAGRPDAAHSVRATVQTGWSSPPGRAQFARVVLDHDRRIVSSGGQASHIMGGLAHANALAVVPAEVTQVHEGDVLEVIPLIGGA
ncbi:gephyrin-like molybdotransferase Glp [Allobranchiibius sp. GilTou38]|uniref:molybdopterin molybdotransferase MoeA n=1 Tax=Allobranchiibius sp. GilTou38 TaxID=2815210 RepID=UPI001AA1B741|nr:gephyrin-like molybdotransferase Glp [Allobranchiibius sp. GilTou38]MBO1765907.1 molybdopterin molybdotransferase MoeA [Allobranchiibius sp. GilTou38]